MEAESESQEINPVSKTALSPDQLSVESIGLCSDSGKLDEATSSSDHGKDPTHTYSLRTRQKNCSEEKISSYSDSEEDEVSNTRLSKVRKVYTSEKPFSCDCGMCFSCKSALLIHRRIHTGEKPFCCSDCGRRFNQKANLSKHKKVHTHQKSFCCSDCGRPFTQKSDLLRHEQFHLGEKPFCCNVCGKHFSRKSHLLTHENVHTGGKPFCCGDCGKCFTHKSNLSAHTRVHTGERPFTCTDCGKGFSHHSHLSRHKKVHTGEKSFACRDCGKRFCLKHHLLSHTLIHTDKKPFSCKNCGKSFAHKSNLRTHEKCHTDKKQLSCRDCGKVISVNSSFLTHKEIPLPEQLCCDCERHSSQENNTGDDQIIIPEDEKDFSQSDCVEACSSKCHFGLDDPLSLGEDEECKADLKEARISSKELLDDVSVKEEVEIDEIPFESLEEEDFNHPMKIKVEEDVF